MNIPNIPEKITITLEKKECKDKLTEDKKIILESNGYKHSGINNLTYIKWYKYSWLPKIGVDELDCYDNIALSFFRITKECKENAEKKLIDTGVSKDPEAHIHTESGNIHPGMDYPTQFCKKKSYPQLITGNGDKIYQIVLCNGLGPKINVTNKENNLYKSEELFVHKASYYPLIKDEEELHDDIRYLFLKKVWEKLMDELKKLKNHSEKS